MKALITGISGFVGSHLGELLVARGDKVMGVGKSGQWRADAPAVLTESASLDAWNIESPAVDSLVEKIQAFAPDAIFHFAGMSIPTQCGMDTPTSTAMRVNVDGTHNVLDLAEKLSSKPKFIFASTVHVYERVTGSAPYVREDSSLDPISAYGQTKLACEQEILRRMDSGLQACIARGFHHIGLRQPDGLMLTDWLNQLADPDCTELTVRSTNSYLDLIDVRDAALAYMMLAKNDAATGVFNLGSGQISKSGDVLEAILALIGRRPAVITQTEDERWNAIADISKLKSLGWGPKHSYQQTISSMISSE